MATKQLLDNIVNGYKTILKDNLVGIYLHGSFVLGSYNPNVSDLDYIIVVKQALSSEKKKELMDLTVNQLIPLAPKKGLEFHILLLSETRKAKPPIHFDFAFSQHHEQKYLRDPEAYITSMVGEDKDLPSHLAIVYEKGLALYGKLIDEVFSPISPSDYWDAVLFDIESAREDIISEPTYVILNLCRSYAYKKTNQFLSKKDGGIWGLNELPENYHGLIEQALLEYTSENKESGSTNAGSVFDKEECQRFSEYMLKKVYY